MTITLRLAPETQSSLRDHLATAGCAFGQPAHTFWQARGDGGVITFYTSGKVVVQGKAEATWAAVLEDYGADVLKRSAPTGAPKQAGLALFGDSTAPFADALSKLPAPTPNAWIGIDETGKGDYFGPLVVVAARVSQDQLPLLAALGVEDSKRLTDKRALAIARDVAKVVPHHAMVLMPRTYNDLYARIGNLNQLLAWAHATSAEELLGHADAELILSDQFSKANLVASRLKERGRACRYQQRTKAEDDPAVAAASILARSLFLRRMEELETTFDVKLHKGAGPPVLAAARTIVQARGPEALADVAKLHFKTTSQVGG